MTEHPLFNRITTAILLRPITVALMGVLIAACSAAVNPSDYEFDASETPASNAAYDALKDALPDLAPEDITPSAVRGILKVQQGIQVMYVTQDGEYAFQGELIRVRDRVSLTEEARKVARVALLESLDAKSLITFKAEPETHSIIVFTDIDCGYCRKLHQDVDALNALGITVQYAAFPRSGMGTPSAEKAEYAWCAQNPNQALTQAKAGEAIDPINCENPVQMHLQLGQQVGVTGTPTIMTRAGWFFPGYAPADDLKSLLDEQG